MSKLGARVFWLIKFGMRTMMPRAAGLPGVEDCDLDAFLHRMQNDAEDLYWMGVVLGAITFAFTPIFTVFIPLPAFLLPKALLEKHAERILASRVYLLRQAVFLLRLSAGMCWGADPAVRAKFALGPYGPDPGTFKS